MKIKQLVMKNIWFKVLAFFLAVISWFYVVGELNKGSMSDKSIFDRILPRRMVAKQIPIKINLIGTPPKGYIVQNDKVSIKPSECIVLGSRSFLRRIEYITTEEIDMSEFTRSIVKRLKIKPVTRGIIMEKDFFVNVVIPIEKIQQDTE